MTEAAGNGRVGKKHSVGEVTAVKAYLKRSRREVGRYAIRRANRDVTKLNFFGNPCLLKALAPVLPGTTTGHRQHGR